MAGLYRAYAQARRGLNPWRSPVLVPLALIPALSPHGNFSITPGGTTTDFHVYFSLVDIPLPNHLSVAFTVEAKRPLSDVSVRIVLLVSSDDLFVDGGDFQEKNVDFAVFDLRAAPGETFPSKVRIELTQDENVRIDPAHVDVANNLIVGAGGIVTDSTRIVFQATGSRGRLHVAGGLITADVVRLNGVEATPAETPADVRGLDTAWIDDPTATKPASLDATWIHLDALSPASVPATDDTVTVDIYTPAITHSPPSQRPHVQAEAGGQLRLGAYRYSFTHLGANGNETDPGPRSAAVYARLPYFGDPPPGPRSVRVTNFPPAPPGATAVRVYRTDPDTDGDGDTGDDVLVAQLPTGTTTFLDTGVYDPDDPGPPGSLRQDLLAINYTSSQPLDLDGQLRFVTAGAQLVTDESYTAQLRTAPQFLRVLYRPGADPVLHWSATDELAEARVTLSPVDTPFGTGVEARLRGAPRSLAVTWTVLGSEFFTFNVTAGASRDPIATRIAAALGPAVIPQRWPDGEAAIAAELHSAVTQSGSPAWALLALRGLSTAAVTLGARDWPDRDNALGRIVVDAEFADTAAFDRDLRVGYSDETVRALQVTGHDVGTQLHAEVWNTPSAIRADLSDARIRWLRSAFQITSGTAATITGHLMLSDTTAHLLAGIAKDGRSASVRFAEPVDLGGRITVHDVAPPALMLPDTDDLTLRPRLTIPAASAEAAASPSLALTVAPDRHGLQTDSHLRIGAAGRGVSGRAAVTLAGGAAAASAEAPLTLRATPGVRGLSDGSGLRALTARVLQLNDIGVHTGVAGADPVRGELPTQVGFAGDRPNHAVRVEMLQREPRIAADPDPRAPAGVRSWLRARTAKLPDRLTLTVANVPDGRATTVGGVAVEASEPWGEGRIFAEPGFVWPDALAGALGGDRGIGLVHAAFESLPTGLEFWLLAHAASLGTRVPVEQWLPSVGPADVLWNRGGVHLKAAQPLRLSWVMAALAGGDSLVCSNDSPVRHGNWTEFIAPFVRLESRAGAAVPLTMTYWDVRKAPPPPAPTNFNPCDDDAPSDDTPTAQGWRIGADTRVTLALKIFKLATPSGPVKARWWTMPTSGEPWNPGVWQLKTELQMEDYSGTVAFYLPDIHRPSGNWQAGPGKWWLRMPNLIPWVGDVYLGNVGGGYELWVPFYDTDGIYSTLPAIFNWTYP